MCFRPDLKKNIFRWWLGFRLVDDDSGQHEPGWLGKIFLLLFEKKSSVISLNLFHYLGKIQ